MRPGDAHVQRESLCGELVEEESDEWGKELLPLAGGGESDEELVEVDIYLGEEHRTRSDTLQEEETQEQEQEIEIEGESVTAGREPGSESEVLEIQEFLRGSDPKAHRQRESESVGALVVGESERRIGVREKRSKSVCCGHSETRKSLGGFSVDSCTYSFEHKERDAESERYIEAFKRHCSEQTRDCVGAPAANADHTLAVGFLSSTADPNSGIMGLDQEQRLLVQREQEAQERLVEHQQQFFYFPPEEEAYAVGYNLVVDLPSRPNPALTVAMGCCPCFIGDPCNTLKRLEYKKAIKTICFFISILQILLFIISLSLDGFASVSENWLLGPTGSALVSMGAKDAYLIKEEIQVWRYVTPCFLHAGLIQIAFNLFAQLRMGLYLERTWGWYRFTVIYFVSGTAGMCLSSCLQPNSISVAASASLMGVMGGYLAQLNVTWQKLEGWQKKMHLSMCVAIIMTTFIIGVGPNYVDSTAHIGGLIVGMVMGYGAFGKEKARNNKRLSALMQVVSWTIVLVFIIAAILLLFLLIPVTDPLPNNGTGSGTDVYGNSTNPYNSTAYWNATDSAYENGDYGDDEAQRDLQIFSMLKRLLGSETGKEDKGATTGFTRGLIESAVQVVGLPLKQQQIEDPLVALEGHEASKAAGVNAFTSLIFRRRDPPW